MNRDVADDDEEEEEEDLGVEMGVGPGIAICGVGVAGGEVVSM